MLNEVSRRIEEYVISYFQLNSKPELTYHNLDHTKTVAKRTTGIAAHYELTETDKFILAAAAWFHDTGYLLGDMIRHEEDSVAIMARFLEQESVEKEIIAVITSCIMATKYPPNPKSLLEEIICDADTYHFGTDEFWKTDPLVRKEIEFRLGIQLNNWWSQSVALLKRHRFFTHYCKNLLNDGKQKNINKLEALITNA